MNSIKTWLLGNREKAMRDGSIWNLIFSMEYSLLSAILMLIVTRVSGLYDAGIFMIAYTVTHMMATIGSFAMRSFQVSDVGNKYSFGTYYASRIVSVVIMVIVCMGYSLVQGYIGERMILIVILCAYRLVEDVEDVFHGEMQKEMRLDIGSKIAAIRIFVATLCFTIAFLLTKNLIISCLSLTISAAILTIVFTSLVSPAFRRITLKTEWNGVFSLLFECLPVCVGGFLYNYLVNAPKYAIDRNLSEETQTIFNILFMPIFAINMLSSFVFKPLIARMGVLWYNKEKKALAKMIVMQILVIVAITIIVIIGGVIIGLDILGWMYGVQLAEFKSLFAVLIIFGGVAAMAAFLVETLTIVRKQRMVIVAYILAAAIDITLIDRLVIQKGIWGAGIMYGAAMGIVVVVLGITLVKSFLTKEKMHG